MGICEKTKDMLFERGAVQFGGFRLKLHEKNPDAPLSPFYFNMRTYDNPKPGPLTSDDCDLVAGCIRDMVWKSGVVFTAICGIPNAGTPIVEALARIIPEPRGFKFVPLFKETTNTGRKIIPMPHFPYKYGEKVVLVDDLATKADTKFEAIDALELMGCEVACLAVLIDREQGGTDELERRGYKVLSAFKAMPLFQYYCDTGKISPEKLAECFNYARNN